MTDGIVDTAISTIETADLTAIEHKILVNFVREAYEPSLAAREVLDRIRDDDRPAEETLRILKQDWHELVSVSEYLHSIPKPRPVLNLIQSLVKHHLMLPWETWFLVAILLGVA